MLLIPVKNLDNAKQRLSPVLSPEERNALAQAMLEDVLRAVTSMAWRPPTSVVTSDAYARNLARRHGLAVIADDDNESETAAIEMATQVCIRKGCTWTLVIPADAPLIKPNEIATVINVAPDAGCVIVPDHKHRGSNAILRRPADLFPLRFGDDSFAPHKAAAQATGYPCVELTMIGISLDVDQPNDLAILNSMQVETETQRLLRRWGVAKRMLELDAAAAQAEEVSPS